MTFAVGGMLKYKTRSPQLVMRNLSKAMLSFLGHASHFTDTISSYSKACLKWPQENRQNKGLEDK